MCSEFVLNDFASIIGLDAYFSLLQAYCLDLNGSTCTTHFNVLKLCILLTQCICVFRMVLTINSDGSPKQY
jgi:hypothetical protein